MIMPHKGGVSGMARLQYDRRHRDKIPETFGTKYRLRRADTGRDENESLLKILTNVISFFKDNFIEGELKRQEKELPNVGLVQMLLELGFVRVFLEICSKYTEFKGKLRCRIYRYSAFQQRYTKIVMG